MGDVEYVFHVYQNNHAKFQEAIERHCAKARDLWLTVELHYSTLFDPSDGSHWYGCLIVGRRQPSEK